MQGVQKIIGDDYMKWESGNRIMISTQTGSGKSTFILETLLPYAAQNHKRIIYFVNRTILKKQLEEKIGKEFSQFRYHIEVITYQKLITDSKLLRNYENSYFVLDEAHYFFCDYHFNPKTDVCFERIMEIKDSVLIFMTATPEYVYLAFTNKFYLTHKCLLNPEDYNYTQLNSLNKLIEQK